MQEHQTLNTLRRQMWRRYEIDKPVLFNKLEFKIKAHTINPFIYVLENEEYIVQANIKDISFIE